MTAQTLTPRPLTREAFAPFGDVIQAGENGAQINNGTSVRFNDLARVKTDANGAAGLSVFRAAPRTLPMRIEMLERHPLGSQAFVPMTRTAFVVVVADADAKNESQPNLQAVCAFKTAPGQGVNFHRGVWHHPLIALNETCDFLVADRIGPGDNCDVFNFPPDSLLSLSLPE